MELHRTAQSPAELPKETPAEGGRRLRTPLSREPRRGLCRSDGESKIPGRNRKFLDYTYTPETHELIFPEGPTIKKN